MTITKILGLILLSVFSAACVVYQQQPIEFSPDTPSCVFSYEGVQITFDYAGVISVKNFNWDPLRVEIYRLGGPLGVSAIKLFDRVVWRNHPEIENGLWFTRGQLIKVVIHFPENEYPIYIRLN